METLAEIAVERGLEPQLHSYDLAALREHPGHPGEEAIRSELIGLTATRPGSGPKRLCLCGHLDVVEPGSEPWDAWSGKVVDGYLYGRGSLDMKGGVIAALHAMAAVEDPPSEVVLMAVSSEEDGGQGAFAALEQDDHFDACLIPEPTDFKLVCAHGGALTFTGLVHGKAAHAAFRLDGESAVDRYVPVHAALAELEGEMNRDVANPLMAELELPYPLSIGRVNAGSWSSTVPDRLEFEGRVGVPVGESPQSVRALVEERLDGMAEISWTGGQFGSGATSTDDAFVDLVGRGELELAGVPYGADMRHFTDRGIPTVMVGPGGLDRVHGVDERVSLDELVRLAELIAATIRGFE
jgi:acetylornithine deacetylase